MMRALSSRGLAAGLGALLLLGASMPLAAQEFRHGLSIFGDLKYPADFKHFDYVNPDAPKGGSIGLMGGLTFDSFNPFIYRGIPAGGVALLFDTLMTRSGDEPDTMYGLVASEVAVAPDRMSVTFKLRPEAKFSDGSAVTAEDVVYSFDILKEKGHPTAYRDRLRDVEKAEVLDPHTVRFSFRGTLTRDLPTTVAGLPVLSKAYYSKRDFEQTTLEPPVGSGAYKIDRFIPGRNLILKRRDDYWGKDLPVTRGQWNFDEVRFEYFRERSGALRELLAGTYDFREEYTARDWVRGYDTAAVRSGQIQRIILKDANPSGTQGFFINTRRAKFSDPRVRRAIELAFDFEHANKNLFESLYQRTQSFFENSEMKAVGKPSPEELALLEPHRAKLPPEVFEEAYLPSVADGTGKDRKPLALASKLLDDAGCKRTGRDRVCPNGEKLEIEFIIDEPSFLRIFGAYEAALKAIGIGVTVRQIDSAQYQERVKSFDFDMVTTRYIMRLTPGIELRDYFGSATAGMNGSRNLAGIKDPVVDALIDKVMAAKNRGELVTAVRALDRVLRAGHYWVPHWYKASHHIAYWDKFARPERKPEYERGAPDTWWYDAEKAAKIKPN